MKSGFANELMQVFLWEEDDPTRKFSFGSQVGVFLFELRDPQVDQTLIQFFDLHYASSDWKHRKAALSALGCSIANFDKANQVSKIFWNFRNVGFLSEIKNFYLFISSLP